jgi:hypothetical protein
MYDGSTEASFLLMPPGRALAAAEPAGLAAPDAAAEAAALALTAGLTDTTMDGLAAAEAAALAGLLAGLLLAGADDPPQAASSRLAPAPATVPPATRMNPRRLTVSAMSLGIKAKFLSMR